MKITAQPGEEGFGGRRSGGESNKQVKEGKSVPGERQEKPVGKEEGSSQILSVFSLQKSARPGA